jgi:hypothetical protein
MEDGGAMKSGGAMKMHNARNAPAGDKTDNTPRTVQGDQNNQDQAK